MAKADTRQSDPITGATLDPGDPGNVPGIAPGMRPELMEALRIIQSMTKAPEPATIDLPRMEVPEYAGPKPWVKKASGIIDSLMALAQAHQAGKDREEGYYPLPVTGGGFLPAQLEAEKSAKEPIKQAEGYNMAQASTEAKMRMENEQTSSQQQWSRENVILNSLLPALLREKPQQVAAKPQDKPEDLMMLEALQEMEPEVREWAEGLLFPEDGKGGAGGRAGMPTSSVQEYEYAMGLEGDERGAALDRFFPPELGDTPETPESLYGGAYWPEKGEQDAAAGAPPQMDPQTFKDFQKEFKRLVEVGEPNTATGVPFPLPPDQAQVKALEIAKARQASRQWYMDQMSGIPSEGAGQQGPSAGQAAATGMLGSMGQGQPPTRSPGQVAARGLLGGGGGAPGAPGQPPGGGMGMPGGGAPAPMSSHGPPATQNQGVLPSITGDPMQSQEVQDPWGAQTEPMNQPALPAPRKAEAGRAEETYPSHPLQPWDTLSPTDRNFALRGLILRVEEGGDINALSQQFYVQYGIWPEDAIKSQEQPAEE